MRLYKDTHHTHTNSFFIMSYKVAISLLAQSNNAEEILAILDDILAEVVV